MSEFNDGPDRTFNLLSSSESQLRNAFLLSLAAMDDHLTITRLTRLLEAGREQEAFVIIEQAWEQFSGSWIRAYITTAESAASFIDDKLVAVVSFDVTNANAVFEMQQNRLRLIRELTNAQIQATSDALIKGVIAGDNPIQQARAFKASLGLTQRQQAAVENYGNLLRANSSQALTRKLRDRRSDRLVARAIESGTPLDEKTIQRMVERYRTRYIAFRATTIARTEALRSVNAGNDRMYGQAIEDGTLDVDQITRIWNTARDERVRSTHRSMHKQKRRVDEPFISGAGAQLRIPGDPAAPAGETIKCRCAVSYRFTSLIEAEDGLAA